MPVPSIPPYVPVAPKFSIVNGAPCVQEKVKIPSALGWDHTKWPIPYITLTYTFGGKSITSAPKTIRDWLDLKHPGWRSWNQYWVDVTAASNGTGTSGSPFNSLWACRQAIDASGAPGYVNVLGGNTLVATRYRNFSNSGAVTATAQHSVWVVTGGPVEVSTHETGLIYTADSTYTKAYKVTRSDGTTAPPNTAFILDTQYRKRGGEYLAYEQVSSIKECDARPGSCYCPGGTNAPYVHPLDGVAPTDARFRCIEAGGNLTISGTTQATFVLLAGDGNSSWQLYGGDAGCWRTNYSGGAGGTDVIHGAENFAAYYSGSSNSAGVIGGVGIQNLNGLAWFCEGNPSSCDHASDDWNFHNPLGCNMYVCTLNVRGDRAGLWSPNVSCNGWTNHDNIPAIVHPVSLEDCRGNTLHCIGTTKTLVIAPKVGGSQGDRMNTGSNNPGEIKVEDTGQMWVHRPDIQYASGGFAPFRVEDSGTMTLCGPVGANDVYKGPSGTVIYGSW